MNPMQKTLVQQTFSKLEPHSATVADLFYSTLFQIAPEVRPMFRGDMKEQGRKLMATLALAVKGLDRLEELVPVLEGLGRRHVQWGVQDEHYDVVGEALLRTLEQGLGPDWSPAVKQAWTAAYGALAGAMKQGAAAAQPTRQTEQVVGASAG